MFAVLILNILIISFRSTPAPPGDLTSSTVGGVCFFYTELVEIADCIGA